MFNLLILFAFAFCIFLYIVICNIDASPVLCIPKRYLFCNGQVLFMFALLMTTNKMVGRPQFTANETDGTEITTIFTVIFLIQLYAAIRIVTSPMKFIIFTLGCICIGSAPTLVILYLWNL